MHGTSTQLRVIIVGGGIAGLTLANCLQHAGIDYVLLEARDEFAPQLGASIGLGPNGSRILDQLGCYDDILRSTVPIDYTGSHRASDGAYIRPKTDAFRLVQARSSYCMCFLDRQTVLQILFDHVKEQEKLLLRKRIIRAVEHPEGVTVSCEDGTTYEGHVIVGADGVHSVVRREMWRAANTAIPTEDQSRMFAEYRCLYAISSPIPGLPSREFDVTYKRDVSPIVITGKNDRVYWFLIERMPQIFRYGSIPRFTSEDAEAFIAKHMDIPLMPDAKVTVRDLWENRQTCNLVPLEEAYFDHWTFGRFVCLGDSVHKVTPNLGSGGNAAIESAAVLANELRTLCDQHTISRTKPSTKDLQHALSSYQRTRHTRAYAIYKASNFVTRLHAMRGPLEYILAHYIMPRAGDLLTDLASDSWIGSVQLNYLLVPRRSLYGTMPFNPELGLGKNERLLWRAFVSVPLLAIAACAWFIPMPPSWGASSLEGQLDFGALYGLLLLESSRRANAMMPMQMPILFGTASVYFGPSIAMPLYFYVHYALSPISRFRAKDLRLTDLGYTRSVLPLLLTLWHIPILTSWVPTRDMSRTRIVLLFCISASQWILRRSGVSPSTIQHDRIDNVARDMPTLQRTAKVLAVTSAVPWVYKTLSSFVRSPSTTGTLSSIFQQSWKEGGVLINASSILWTIYLFHDLKKAKMIHYGWLKISGLLIGSTICFGPTAIVAAAWAWREGQLATKVHWGAVVDIDGQGTEVTATGATSSIKK